MWIRILKYEYGYQSTILILKYRYGYENTKVLTHIVCSCHYNWKLQIGGWLGLVQLVGFGVGVRFGARGIQTFYLN